MSFKQGRIGIGRDPIFPLDVNGSARIDGDLILAGRFSDSAGNAIQLGGGSGVSSVPEQGRQDEPSWSNATLKTAFDGNVGIGTTDPKGKLHIHGGGLHVFANAVTASSDAELASNAGDANIFMDVNNHASSTAKNGIIWKTKYQNNAGYTKTSAGIYFQPEGNYFRGALTFYTNGTSNQTTNATERLRINMNGNVGIGTTSPYVPLHASCGTFASTGENTPQVYNTTAYANVSAAFTRKNTDGGNIFGLFIGNLANSGASYLQNLSINNNSYYNLSLQPNGGNVGIGTTDPGSYKLKVDGNTHCSGSATCTGHYNYGFGYISHGTTSTGLGSTTDWNYNGESQLKLIGSNNCMTFRVTTSANSRAALIQVGHESSGFSAYKGNLYLNRWGGGVYYGTSAVSTSDDRIKHNEKEITNALSIINKLKPMHYIKTSKLYDRSHNFNLNSNNKPIKENGEELIFESDYIYESGLIAQEIQNIPELSFCVRGEETEKVIKKIYKKDNSGNDILDNSGNKIIQEEIETIENISLSVDYNSIFTTHISATQELNNKVIALENENAELKAELAAIKQHLGI